MKLFLMLGFLTLNIYGFKLDRVIVASDANPMYLDFWPLVARAWKEVVGLKPTLVLIADSTVTVDETIGDVIRFEPIPGISTALQAQVIRHLAPAYFEEEGCIISDMDMIPLSKKYFVDAVQHIPEDNFIIYTQLPPYDDRITMCYNAAKGKVFKEVFNITSVGDIREIIKNWADLKLGWNTDEIALSTYLKAWPKYKKNCVYLNQDCADTRINRAHWSYDKKMLKNGLYRDSHLLRPYNEYKKEIDAFVADLYGEY